MMRSLYSGVAGLKTHQTKMDVIGNNIANVNTVGYKSQSVTFSDVFYQTTQNASGANPETGKGGTNAKQIGLGSTVSSISTAVSTAGGSQTTNNPFDIMINGKSMFIVNNAGTNYFTKAGNFTVDSAGTLVTSQGYAVQGWQADANGNIEKNNVSSIELYSAENMYASPVATTDTSVSGNLNKEDESFKTEKGISYNITFYDTLGYKYQATIGMSRTDDQNYSMKVNGLTCNGKDLYVRTFGGTLSADETAANAVLDGMLATTASIQFSPISGALVDTTGGDGRTIKDADGNDYEYSVTLVTTGLGIASLTDNVEMNMKDMTCLGTDTSITTTRGDVEGLNGGRAVGTMSGVSVQTDGKIVASYDNGDERVIAQIAVANFVNLSGLEKQGDNLFKATLNSGEFDGIGDDITEDGGYFSTGVLEMSNVDLAQEFTDMITTQRGYQANSRIITVSDTLLEELINLKR